MREDDGYSILVFREQRNEMNRDRMTASFEVRHEVRVRVDRLLGISPEQNAVPSAQHHLQRRPIVH
jgi:hypothetical protein